MGTQSSFGGPSDRQGLLPKWAFLPPDSAPGDVPIAPPTPSDLPVALPPTDKPAPTQIKRIVSPATDAASWRSAKTRLGAAAKSRGRGNGFRAAGRAYVRALGGIGRAATSARSGRGSTASLGGFLATVASQGLDTALKSLKLSSLVGKDADTVFAGLMNAISPEGSSREEIAARDAVAESLCFLYEKLVTDQADTASAFAELGAELVAEALLVSVSAYVYERWLIDLGRKIEERAITAAEAVRLEEEMKQYVRESIKVDLAKTNVLEMNWKGTDGRELVQRIYEDAYAFLGGLK